MFLKFIERICRWLAIIFLLAVIISYIQIKNGGTHIGSLKERVQQLGLKIILKTDHDGGNWVLSYPGRYLRFPHNFEKV